MVVYNYSGKEVNAKVVYYGPALSGKTTNLEWIYSKIPTEYSGKMVSLRTQADRTIFFDFLPLELGLIDGFKTRFMLYTVPGQVYYNATRKMVLKGVDGIVFVADSEAGRMQDNLESFENLKDNLTELGIDPASIPMVLQWNKRDLPNIVEASALESAINEFGVPTIEASAPTGEGVYETLHRVSEMVYRKLTAGDASSATDAGLGAGPEESLFGEAIAARLQEIDHPIHHEPLAVAEMEEQSEDGPVLESILGRRQLARAEATPTQAAEATSAAGTHDLDAPMVTELVDEVLGHLDEELESALEEDLYSDKLEQVASPVVQPAVTPVPQEVDSAGQPMMSAQSETNYDGDPLAGVFDEVEKPMIQHDSNPFDSGSHEVLQEESSEDLGLITDPMRKGSSTPPPATGPTPTGFGSPPSDAKTLEIPVTIDAEALASGKTIRIVLNLQG